MRLRLPMNVVPLAHSTASAARRMGCTQQRVLELIEEDALVAVMVNGKPRIPVWNVTDYWRPTTEPRFS